MKIKEWSLHFGLILIVLISVIFSWLILFNPADFQKGSKTPVEERDSEIMNVTTKELEDVYTPTSLMYSKTANKKVQYFNTQSDIADGAKKIMHKVEITSIEVVAKNNSDKYLAMLMQKQNFILNYPDILPIKYVSLIFNKVPKKMMGNTDTIDQIIIPNQVESKHEIYFLNSKSQDVYKIKVKNLKIQELINLTKARSTQEIATAIENVGDGYRWIYPQGVKLKEYSYLISKESAGNLVAKLMGPNTSTTINTKQQGNKTIYSDGTNQRMTVDNKVGEIEYVNYSDSTTRNNKRSTLSEMLRSNLNKLNSLGISLDDVRYSNYNNKNNEIIYRNYIAGYPIVSEDNYGTYRLQNSDSKDQKFIFSLYGLQVPLPSDNNEKALPSTNEVLYKLSNSGYNSNRVKAIKIAYSWQKNSNSNQVVDLVPTYLIKVDGKWIDYKKVLQDAES